MRLTKNQLMKIIKDSLNESSSLLAEKDENILDSELAKIKPATKKIIHMGAPVTLFLIESPQGQRLVGVVKSKHMKKIFNEESDKQDRYIRKPITLKANVFKADQSKYRNANGVWVQKSEAPFTSFFFIHTGCGMYYVPGYSFEVRDFNGNSYSKVPLIVKSNSSRSRVIMTDLFEAGQGIEYIFGTKRQIKSTDRNIHGLSGCKIEPPLPYTPDRDIVQDALTDEYEKAIAPDKLKLSDQYITLPKTLVKNNEGEFIIATLAVEIFDELSAEVQAGLVNGEYGNFNSQSAFDQFIGENRPMIGYRDIDPGPGHKYYR